MAVFIIGKDHVFPKSLVFVTNNLTVVHSGFYIKPAKTNFGMPNMAVNIAEPRLPQQTKMYEIYVCEIKKQEK